MGISAAGEAGSIEIKWILIHLKTRSYNSLSPYSVDKAYLLPPKCVLEASDSAKDLVISRSKEMIFFYSCMWAKTHHLVWYPHFEKNDDKLKKVQRRVETLIWRIENMLHSKELHLFSFSKRRLSYDVTTACEFLQREMHQVLKGF